MFTDFDLNISTGKLALLRLRERISMIVIVDISTGKRLTGIPEHFLPHTPRFSPDGKLLAFSGNGRIWLHSMEAGETEPIVDIPYLHSGFASWSPDGQQLAFSAYGVGSKRNRPPRIFRVGINDGVIVELKSGRELDADLFPQWSVPGVRLAFLRRFYDSPEPHNAVVITDRDLHSQRQVPLPTGVSHLLGRFCWSPDDRQLLITERGETTQLKVFDASDLSLVWAVELDEPAHACFDPTGTRVLAVYNNTVRIFEPPSVEPISDLFCKSPSPIQITLTGPALASERNGLLFLGTDGVLYRWNPSGVCESVLSGDPVDEKPPQERRDYRFKARDGRDIPVHRHVPENANGRAIVYVDGGPSPPIGEDDPVVNRLVEEGYEVIRPAYRGKGGYGEEHEMANRGECGRADVLDVIDCALDWRRRFDAKDRPLAVSGFSYGGFLTFLALTHREAPWSCGITLWGVTELMITWRSRGLPVDPVEREVALNERSPVRRAEDINFPLLMLHGGRDTTSTTSDVLSIQDSVKESGIDCELVVFEEDTHGLALSRTEMLDRMLKFLDSHCQ